MKVQFIFTVLLFLFGSHIIGQSSFNLVVRGEAKIEVMQTASNAAVEVMREPDGAIVQKKELVIGDNAFGGIIFYIDKSGEHGLVSASTDLSNGIRWFAGTNGMTRAQGRGIYAGEMNTSIIISSQIAIGDDGAPYAAALCQEYIASSFGNWYLPSVEELQLMYNNLHVNGIGNFTNTQYWSSTEHPTNSSSQAQSVNFLNGDEVTSFMKSDLYRVRPIRSF